MKELNSIRKYLQFLSKLERKDKQGNTFKTHKTAEDLLDKLDLIEAYIQALEIQRERSDYNPYREALAKVCVHYFAELYLPKELYMSMSLEECARSAPDFPQWNERDAAILDKLQNDFALQRAEYYRALADDLVNVQEVRRYKLGYPVDQKYVDLYYESEMAKEQLKASYKQMREDHAKGY